jgi:hypothetical protein
VSTLPKLPVLPAEVWAAIGDRIKDMDALLRLACVNKFMHKSNCTAIKNARVYDDYLFHSLLECMKIEVEAHVGVSMHFEEIGHAHESGSPVLPRGYLAYPCGYDVIIPGERFIYKSMRVVSKLTVRSGFVKAVGGFTFVFPGDENCQEIECLATMNALGVDSVVLRSLNGERMISNLDPGGLDLPSGSDILDFLKLFDQANGQFYWSLEELVAEAPTMEHWDLDDMNSDMEVFNSNELEANEVDDTAHIVCASGDEADIVDESEECDCIIVDIVDESEECDCIIVGFD